MQTTSDRYDTASLSDMRRISWAARISFTKNLDEDVGLFTLNQSLLDGGDVLTTSNREDIQPWDKYAYSEVDDRVIEMEITHEEQDPFSLMQGMADFTLNNVDDIFSPEGDLSEYILPRRPVKLFQGFVGRVLPLFFGLTEAMPEVDRQKRTSKWHAIDFLSQLYEQEISETIILLDKRSDEILAHIFENEFDLTSSQYNLDTGNLDIPFFYVPKGEKFAKVAEKLMEAELGRMFMNELGEITFKNRYKYDVDPVMTLSESNVIDYTSSSVDEIINSVRIEANPRELQENVEAYSDEQQRTLDPNDTVEIFVEFEDPVTSIDTPTFSSEESAGESYYLATSSDVALDSIEVFSESAKLTFTNNSTSEQSINEIVLWGDQARPIYRQPINILSQNDDSVAKYGERWYPSEDEPIRNDFIQDEETATNIGLILENDYAELGSILDFTIHGDPALQVGDPVEVQIEGHDGVYTVTKIVNTIRDGGHQQKLRVKRRPQANFFTLNQSLLNGNDVLGFAA